MIGILKQGSAVLIGADHADDLAYADWLAEHVDWDAIFWGDSLLVPPHRIERVVAGLTEAGFVVEEI